MRLLVLRGAWVRRLPGGVLVRLPRLRLLLRGVEVPLLRLPPGGARHPLRREPGLLLLLRVSLELLPRHLRHPGLVVLLLLSLELALRGSSRHTAGARHRRRGCLHGPEAPVLAAREVEDGGEREEGRQRAEEEEDDDAVDGAPLHGEEGGGREGDVQAAVDDLVEGADEEEEGSGDVGDAPLFFTDS